MIVLFKVSDSGHTHFLAVDPIINYLGVNRPAREFGLSDLVIKCFCVIDEFKERGSSGKAV